MDSNNCSNDSESVRKFLLQLEEKSDTAMIPAVVMLVIFSVVGLAGNSLVLMVYSKKMQLSPTKVLIMTIATFDLVANLGAIPSEINIMMDSWTFSQPWVCKLKVFLGAFATGGGAVSLCVVAAIRYRKVCRPYGWQFTIRQAVIASVLTSILALLISIPYIIIYGVRTRATTCPNIDGHECFASDYYFSTIWPLLNNVLFAVCFTALAVSVVILYTLIGNMAFKHSKLHGVCGEVTVTTTQNNHASSQGLPSSDNEPIASLDKQTTQQTPTWPSGIKTKNVRKGYSQIMKFCECNIEYKKTEEETSSTINTKNTTAASDTANTTSETTSSDFDHTTSRQLANPHCCAGVRKSLDIVELKGEELAVKCEKPEEFQRNESRKNSPVHQDRSYDLAVYEKHQHKKKEQDLPKKSPPVVSNKTKSKPIANGRVNRRRLGRMTAMLIIISAIFVLGYFPFLALTVVKNRLPEKYASLNMAELVVFNLFYRLYFLNSAVNPIVYSFCDLNFRRECYRLLTCKPRIYK